MSKLRQRVVTAVILVVLLLAVLFAAPAPVAVLVATVLFVLAAWEWSRFLGFTRTRDRAAYALLVGAGCALALEFVPAPIPLEVVAALSLAWWAVAFLCLLRFPIPISPWVAGAAGFVVLVPAWLGLVMLVGQRPEGPVLVIFLLALVWAADIGAYFVGRRIGRTRLAPQVSPGKTWEGVAGGLVASALVAAGGAWYLKQPLLPLALIGLSVAAISVVGDLTESMFKRNVGVKDSGRLFPGHGGVLDRIDSITAAVPLFVLEAQWLGLLAA